MPYIISVERSVVQRKDTPYREAMLCTNICNTKVMPLSLALPYKVDLQTESPQKHAHPP